MQWAEEFQAPSSNDLCLAHRFRQFAVDAVKQGQSITHA